MAHPRTPDDLDELDRRVYDLAVQSIPLAEIAVRMGVPVPQADERIQRVCNRLGVADRAALRAGLATPARAPDEGPIIGLDFAIPDIEPELPRHSRRAVLAGGATALALFGGAAAVALTRRRGGAPASTAPTEAPSQEASPTPPADDFGGLPIEVEGGLNQRFETRTWVKDAPIDWEHGLFWMLTTTGDVQGFRFIGLPVGPDGQPRASGYGILGSGRFVFALDNTGRVHLADMWEPRRSWSYPSSQIRLIAAADTQPNAWLLFSEAGPSGLDTGRFFIVGAPPGPGLRLAQEFRLPSATGSQPAQALVSPGGETAAIWAGSVDGEAKLYLVELPSGRVIQSTAALASKDGPPPVGVMLRPLFPASSKLVIGWRPGRSATSFTYILDWDEPWDFDLTAVKGIDRSGASFVSTDGRFQLVEQFLTDTNTEVAGLGASQWPAVQLHQFGDPRPDWSMLSASISFADLLTPNPWLADGSGFVARVRASEPSANDPDPRQYAVLSTDGLTITRLPSSTAGGVPGRVPGPVGAPAPSPYDPDLIAFGRLQLYNRRTGDWLTANIDSSAGPDHLDPWAPGPGQMVFALPHGGHGGASSPILLTPKRVDGEADPDFRFVVARTGDGLNLRTGPATTTQPITVVPDGTTVELVEDLKMPVGRRGAFVGPEGTWLSVRSAEYGWGWVSAAYLDWA